MALRTAASEQLIRQQREQRTLVAGLRKKERALKQELKKQQQQADALGRRIQQVIEEEARKAAAAAAAKKKNATQKSTAPSGYLMSKDEEQLSRNFAQNRGKLPTPLSGRYRIIAHFGTQQHPDLKYVKINNQGIDLQTQPGTRARSVFDGVVTSIFVMPGYNTSVIVRHGNYLTIYSNLSTIYVKTGDKVNLERSMLMNGRLDGHIVQGHVDCTARCTKVEEADGSWYYTFVYDSTPDMVCEGYTTVEKGSITVNGVSLTVCNSRPGSFQVAIIPYTHEHTNFHQIAEGSVVNLEFDIVGKYISRIMTYGK